MAARSQRKKLTTVCWWEKGIPAQRRVLFGRNIVELASNIRKQTNRLLLSTRKQMDDEKDQLRHCAFLSLDVDVDQ